MNSIQCGREKMGGLCMLRSYGGLTSEEEGHVAEKEEAHRLDDE